MNLVVEKPDDKDISWRLNTENSDDKTFRIKKLQGLFCDE